MTAYFCFYKISFTNDEKFELPMCMFCVLVFSSVVFQMKSEESSFKLFGLTLFSYLGQGQKKSKKNNLII